MKGRKGTDSHGEIEDRSIRGSGGMDEGEGGRTVARGEDVGGRRRVGLDGLPWVVRAQRASLLLLTYRSNS